ncbi:hypothetical protein J4218_06895 [Candidatus Pacearchaeota archaeon]|nr:hypothetical protein [Candidatus Pacearchaeota archaeon]
MVVDKVLIEKQAKEILDKFAKALEKVEKETKEDFEGYVDREEFERAEVGSVSKEIEKSRFADKSVIKNDSEFKKRILDNAPSHDDDFVIGERGSWK